MTTTSDTATLRPVTVAFANCFDATTFGRTVLLTVAEETLLRRALAALQGLGFVLPPSLEPAAPGCGFADVVDYLRASLGGMVADLALGSVADPARAGDPPAAVVPVWAFEPEGEGEDVMLSSGMLWGTDLLIEALRVAGDDDPEPVPAVRERFLRWADASGGRGGRATVRLPGRDGAYVVFASVA